MFTFHVLIFQIFQSTNQFTTLDHLKVNLLVKLLLWDKYIILQVKTTSIIIQFSAPKIQGDRTARVQGSFGKNLQLLNIQAGWGQQHCSCTSKHRKSGVDCHGRSKVLRPLINILCHVKFTPMIKIPAKSKCALLYNC